MTCGEAEKVVYEVRAFLMYDDQDGAINIVLAAVREALEEAEKRAKLLEKALGYFAICKNQVKVPDIQHGGFLETRNCGYCRGCGAIAALSQLR